MHGVVSGGGPELVLLFEFVFISVPVLVLDPELVFTPEFVFEPAFEFDPFVLILIPLFVFPFAAAFAF